MPRADLLALTEDDLATLANRGLVKRALRDLDSGQGPMEIAEQPGDAVRAVWPDGAVCTLAPDHKVDDRACTCQATTICRHIVGTILAYQRRGGSSAETQAKAGPWNPGDIPDAVLEPLYKPSVFDAIRKEWQAGLVVEVHELVKPLARIHTTGNTVRFLVPGDVRYVRCDCAEETPCRHVALAIWAFREKNGAGKSALLALNQKYRGEEGHSREIDAAVEALAEFGLAELPPTWVRRWESLEAVLRREKFPWLAAVVSDILQARERYLHGDARFSPADLASLAGELLIRGAAIRSCTASAPQLFVRGSARDTPAEIGTARLIGLGSFVEVRRKCVSLNIPLQDTSTGQVVSVRKDSDTPETFAQLAASHFNRQYRYEAIASGQILMKSARRSPNLELSASRARLVVHPQAFEWEKLRPPVLVEEFAEVLARESVMPPASLRPRRLNDDVRVFAVAKVTAVAFDTVEQRLECALEDAAGGSAILSHPYYSRGAEGFAVLRRNLGASPLRFVAGKTRLTARGLEIEPCGLVFESDGVRFLVQPWVDRDAAGGGESPTGDASMIRDPIRHYLGEMEAIAGEVLTIGLERADARTARRWRDLAVLGEQLGFTRVASPVAGIAGELEMRRSQVNWSAAVACEHIRMVLRNGRLGMDLR